MELETEPRLAGVDLQLPLRLRSYVVREDAKAERPERDTPLDPSDWSLTFDCETTVDAAQKLRFGTFQLRKGETIRRAGFFLADDLSEADADAIQRRADTLGLEVLSVRNFVDWVLIERAYDLAGVVVGFNLPFDISRIAIQAGLARGYMRGGFSFLLSRIPGAPRVRVKHVSSRLSFINYSANSKKRTPKGQKARGLSVRPRRGYFIDVQTLAAALMRERYTLDRLSRTLKVDHPKSDAGEHGTELTDQYIDYAYNDVQCTWECYRELQKRLATHRLTTIGERELYSEASLGKAYLRAMNVKPWREEQPDVPPELIGQILSSYYGGRAEVRIRREITRTLYCDFLSMYPTVCTLMGLWRFVVSEGVQWADATAETQAWLDATDVADLQDRATWRELTTLVQLTPSDDVLPVRARYGDSPSANIGVNRLSSPFPLWYTLADVLAGKLLGGKTPRIARAIRFAPEAPQPGLSPIHVAGNEAFRVDPAVDDFYRGVINLRQEVKRRRNSAPAEDGEALDAEQLALKILANATSYGIFIEMRVEDLDKAERVTCYGSDGVGYSTLTTKAEEPGAYFHPLLATLITGAARLMLATAERRARDEGLDWVFCDTDSLAIAKPESMEERDFIGRARAVCDWFTPLNPYDQPGSILQVEDVNYRADGGKAEGWAGVAPLYCLAISAKRYALFNLDDSGEPILRKASAHGLGHRFPPYDDPDRERRGRRIREIKIDLWQEDLWKRIIVERLKGAGVELGLDQDPRLATPAASRFAATKPALLRWFAGYNRDRSYAEQVKPFGFLLNLESLPIAELAAIDPRAERWSASHKREPAPAAAFDSDLLRAADHAFDRQDRETAIPRSWLKSYARSLAQYHLQPERKFGGEDRLQSGTLSRLHVNAVAPLNIGKETERWDEALFLGEDEDAPEYGLSKEAREHVLEIIKAAKERFTVRALCRAARISDHTLARLLTDPNEISDLDLMKVAEAISLLTADADRKAAAKDSHVPWALSELRALGLQEFARQLGMDPANLLKELSGKRKLGPATLRRLRQLRETGFS